MGARHERERAPVDRDRTERCFPAFHRHDSILGAAPARVVDPFSKRFPRTQKSTDVRIVRLSGPPNTK
jgi:hypothetical protein